MIGDNLFEIGDTVVIKRSNGQLKEVTLEAIDYEKRTVKVIWQESVLETLKLFLQRMVSPHPDQALHLML